MKFRTFTPLAVLLCGAALGYGANPFLNAPDDNPVAARFRGAEWGDNIAQEEIGLSARVVTTRIARTSWGEIYKITFTDIASRAQVRRRILPEYFIVTDGRIVLLHEEKPEAAVKKLAALETPPEFEKSDVYAVAQRVTALSCRFGLPRNAGQLGPGGFHTELLTYYPRPGIPDVAL